MAHNPIIRRITVDRLGSAEKVPAHAEGVLYSRNRLSRILQPGEALTWGEKLQGHLTLYFMDCANHTMTWRVNLPAAHKRDVFPCTITLAYRIADSAKMVADAVTDTETLISQGIEPKLRREVRDLWMHDFRGAEERIAAVLSDTTLFDSLGLRVTRSDVAIAFDDEQLRRTEDLEQLQRAMTRPQQVEHATDLPTKEDAYRFQARIVVQYRVTDTNLLPTATLGEAEAWLWQRVQTVSRRAARRYAVNQVDDAEHAIQEALKVEEFVDHGLAILNPLVQIELDERAATHARQLDDIRTHGLLDRAQAGVDEERRQRELIVTEANFQRLTERLMSPTGILAESIARGEISVSAVVDMLREQHDKRQSVTVDMLKQLIDKKNALPDEDAERLAQLFMQTLVTQVDQMSGFLSLGTVTPLGQLSSGEQDGRFKEVEASIESDTRGVDDANVVESGAEVDVEGASGSGDDEGVMVP